MLILSVLFIWSSLSLLLLVVVEVVGVIHRYLVILTNKKGLFKIRLYLKHVPYEPFKFIYLKATLAISLSIILNSRNL